MDEFPRPCCVRARYVCMAMVYGQQAGELLLSTKARNRCVVRVCKKWHQCRAPAYLD